MPKNKLYSFIEEEISRGMITSEILDTRNFDFKQDAKNHHYILYHLPCQDLTNIKLENGQFYQLKSHHFSFFERINDANACMTEGHYTAFFKDKKNRQYRLHVYFDQRDQLTTAPIFSIESNNAYTKLNLNDEFSDILTQFAIDKSYRFMAALRQQHQSVSGTHEQRYFELEAELTQLSMNLTNNHDEYQRKLDEVIVTLSLLEAYHYNSHYKDLLTLFKSIKSSFSLPHQDTPRKDDDNSTRYVYDILKSPAQKPKKISLKELLSLAEKSYNAFQSMAESHADTDALNLFLHFKQTVHEALLFAYDKQYFATTTDLQNIQSYIAKCHAIAKKFLMRFLLQNQFDSAAKLKEYLHPVPDNLIRMAFQTRNAALIDFLLTNSHFPVNTFTVENNLSPVLYCYHKNSAKTPMVACLSVLIKHHASILVKTADGLSVAHHICDTVNHPLKKALLDNAEVTFGKPTFYKTLLRDISYYLDTHSLSESKRNQLLTSKQLFSMFLINIVRHGHSRGSFLARQNMESVESITECLDPGVVDRIKSDKDFLKKYEKYQQVLRDYVLKLPAHEKQAMDIKNKKFLADISTYIRSLDKVTSNNRISMLNAIDDFTEIIELRAELLDKEQILLSKNSGEKVLKKAYNRQFKIMDEIEKLQVGKYDLKRLEKENEIMKSKKLDGIELFTPTKKTKELPSDASRSTLSKQFK